jgi:hypothetical protein
MEVQFILLRLEQIGSVLRGSSIDHRAKRR